MVFYSEHSCEVCADAELELQSFGIEYVKYFITASTYPNLILIWRNGESTMIPRNTIPYVPALFDKEKNFLICGLEGISNYLRKIND